LYQEYHIFVSLPQVVSHLTDTVKRLEKEKDVQAAEIKKMKGFANFFSHYFMLS